MTPTQATERARKVRVEIAARPVWELRCRRGSTQHGPVTVWAVCKPSGVCPCGVSMIAERKAER